MKKDIIIIEFKEYLIEKKFTKSSIDGYVFGLNGFLDYLDNKELNFHEFSNSDIIMYKESLVNSPQTVNVKLAAIKKYCEYLKSKNNFSLEYNVSSIKTERKKSVNVIRDFNDILKNIDLFQKDSDIILRDKLIFGLLYYSGIRTAELVKIKRSDVCDGHLLINGKKIIINTHLYDDLVAYTDRLNLQGGDYLFFSYSRGNKKNKSDRNLTVKSVEDLFNKYTKFFGDKHSISDLRNSYKLNNEKAVTIDSICNHDEINWHGDCLSFFNTSV